MSKEDFVTKLVENGYRAELSGSIPMVYTDDIENAKAVTNFARSVGYQYSFGIKKSV